MRSCSLSEILALTASIKYIGGCGLNPVEAPLGQEPLVTAPFRPCNSGEQAQRLITKRKRSRRTRTWWSASKVSCLMTEILGTNFISVREISLVCDMFHRAWCKSQRTLKSYVKEW